MVEGKQFRIVWQTVNRAKRKTTSREERLQKWKEHFKNLLGDPPENTDNPLQKIANDLQEIKLGLIEEDEPDAEKKESCRRRRNR